MADEIAFPRRRALSEKLADVRPSQSAPESAVPVARIDEAAERHGFTSREPLQPLRRDRTLGPTVALNLRAPVRVAVPFQRFCEEQRMSYWEGIEELMKRAGLLD